MLYAEVVHPFAVGLESGHGLDPGIVNQQWRKLVSATPEKIIDHPSKHSIGYGPTIIYSFVKINCNARLSSENSL